MYAVLIRGRDWMKRHCIVHCTVVLGWSAVPFIIELRLATRSRGRAVSRWFTRLFFWQMLSGTVWHVVRAKYSRVVVRERQNGDDKRGSATWTREMQLRSYGAHALLGRRSGEDVAAARARCVLADWNLTRKLTRCTFPVIHVAFPRLFNSRGDRAIAIRRSGIVRVIKRKKREMNDSI